MPKVTTTRGVHTLADVKALAAEYDGKVTSYQPRPGMKCAAFTTEFLSRDAVEMLRNKYGAGVNSLGLGMVVYFPQIPWKSSRAGSDLRQRLIRLAYTHPGPVRDAILPLLQKRSNTDFFDTVVDLLEKSNFHLQDQWMAGGKKTAILKYKLGAIEVSVCRGGVCVTQGDPMEGRLEGDDDLALDMAKKALRSQYKLRNLTKGFLIALESRLLRGSVEDEVSKLLDTIHSKTTRAQATNIAKKIGELGKNSGLSPSDVSKYAGALHNRLRMQSALDIKRDTLLAIIRQEYMAASEINIDADVLANVMVEVQQESSIGKSSAVRCFTLASYYLASLPRAEREAAEAALGSLPAQTLAEVLKKDSRVRQWLRSF